MWATKMDETVTNILKLSPRHCVSSIRHQHQCNHYYIFSVSIINAVFCFLAYLYRKLRKISTVESVHDSWNPNWGIKFAWSNFVSFLLWVFTKIFDNFYCINGLLCFTAILSQWLVLGLIRLIAFESFQSSHYQCSH